MEKRILDANVLIRFLLVGHEAHYKKAKQLFQQAESGKVRLVLLEVVLAEVVWVLTSVYHCERKEVVDCLIPLIQHGGIKCQNASVLRDALQRFKKINVDFIDCMVAAHSVERDHAVSSFDKDFKKFKDVTVVAPGS